MLKKSLLSAFSLSLLLTAFSPITSLAATKQKAIIAVENTPVFTFPDVLNKSWDKLPYGYEVRDLGGTPGWNTIVHKGITAYVKKTRTTLYTPIKEKGIVVRVNKGYLFSTPSKDSQTRGYFVKGVALQAVGVYGNWYYVKLIDSKGRLINGFISKTVAW